MQLLLLCALFLGVVNADQLLFEVQQPISDEYLMCPDQNSKCPKTATCCQLSNGQWGCCPFPQAKCCADQVHCCPQDYSCNADKGQCVKAINNVTIPWAQKQPSSVSSSSLEAPPPAGNDLRCADGTICAGTSSCCRTYQGTFRCCPYPNDVCCSDGYTCCPRCTICDIVNRRCVSGFETEEWKPLTDSIPAIAEPEGTPALEKTPAFFVADALKQGSLGGMADLRRCNSTRYCLDSQTCCLLPGGVWGCCQYRFARCCTGSIFCCPWPKRCSYPPGLCY